MKQLSYLIASLALALGSAIALASDSYSYQCKHDNDVRTIEVIYLQRESALPCEVNYIKNGVSETLWSARYEQGYCEARAAEFSKRQEEWGWVCEKTTSSEETDAD